MFKNIQDIHNSALSYIPEDSLTPPSNKYHRISIPSNPNRHCLGYLEGTAANYKERTRNDRKYILKLWQNVAKSEDFLEGMENATIVGELDHPEERVDYSLTKGAIILTDFEIREDEGIVWARFAILDNEEGRTLLSYVKFGSILGVSSRGLGDEVVQNGETIIDPDTYEFFCFDVVAFPAVKSARQQYVDSGVVNETAPNKNESITIHKHLESLLEEKINNVNDKNELNNLKVVIESTSLKSKNSLVESITHKLSSLSESTDNQSNISEENVEENNADIEIEKLKSEISSLRETLKKRTKNSAYFRKKLQEKGANENELEDVVADNLNIISDLNQQLNEAKRNQDSLKLELAKTCEELNKANSKNKRWKYRFENKLKSNKALQEDNSKLSKKVENLSAKSRKNKELIESLEASVNHYEKSLRNLKNEQHDKLIESKKAQDFQKHEVERLNKQLSIMENTNCSLNDKNKLLESNIEKLTKELKQKEKNIKESKNLEVKMLNEYIKSQCCINNLNYDAVINSLPKDKTLENVDKVIKELSERQMKFDMMPMSIPAITGRIVEHNAKTSKSNSDEPSSFLVEALSRNK